MLESYAVKERQSIFYILEYFVFYFMIVFQTHFPICNILKNLHLIIGCNFSFVDVFSYLNLSNFYLLFYLISLCFFSHGFGFEN